MRPEDVRCGGGEGEPCLGRGLVAEGVEGEDDLGDHRVRVRTAGLGVGGGGGLLPGAGDYGGAFHEPHAAFGPRRLQGLHLLCHRCRVGGGLVGFVAFDAERTLLASCDDGEHHDSPGRLGWVGGEGERTEDEGGGER